MSRLHSVYVRRDRIAGALWGLLIGCAFGRGADENVLSLESGLLTQGPTPSSPVLHTWSLDGAQALCLLMATPPRFQ